MTVKERPFVMADLPDIIALAQRVHAMPLGDLIECVEEDFSWLGPVSVARMASVAWRTQGTVVRRTNCCPAGQPLPYIYHAYLVDKLAKLAERDALDRVHQLAFYLHDNIEEGLLKYGARQPIVEEIRLTHGDIGPAAADIVEQLSYLPGTTAEQKFVHFLSLPPALKRFKIYDGLASLCGDRAEARRRGLSVTETVFTAPIGRLKRQLAFVISQSPGEMNPVLCQGAQLLGLEVAITGRDPDSRARVA